MLSSFFIKKEEEPIKFYMEKYWVIFSERDYADVLSGKERSYKLDLEVEAVMKRLFT